MSLQRIAQSIQKIASKSRAKTNQRFFKMQPGQYGEKQKFIGLSNPEVRAIAKDNYELPKIDMQTLLASQIHEQKLMAIVIMMQKMKKKLMTPEQTYKVYMNNLENINNWDLIDISAPHIIGQYLVRIQSSHREILYKLAYNSKWWYRRISIISTWAFIKHQQYEDTLAIAQILLTDKHDLIHKAVGWMLRELGKKKINKLEQFIQKNYHIFPRTALRYAIEKFEEPKRKLYLKGQF